MPTLISRIPRAEQPLLTAPAAVISTLMAKCPALPAALPDMGAGLVAVPGSNALLFEHAAFPGMCFRRIVDQTQLRLATGLLFVTTTAAVGYVGRDLSRAMAALGNGTNALTVLGMGGNAHGGIAFKSAHPGLIGLSVASSATNATERSTTFGRQANWIYDQGTVVSVINSVASAVAILEVVSTALRGEFATLDVSEPSYVANMYNVALSSGAGYVSSDVDIGSFGQVFGAAEIKTAVIAALADGNSTLLAALNAVYDDSLASWVHVDTRLRLEFGRDFARPTTATGLFGGELPVVITADVNPNAALDLAGGVANVATGVALPSSAAPTLRADGKGIVPPAVRGCVYPATVDPATQAPASYRRLSIVPLASPSPATPIRDVNVAGADGSRLLKGLLPFMDLSRAAGLQLANVLPADLRTDTESTSVIWQRQSENLAGVTGADSRFRTDAEGFLPFLPAEQVNMAKRQGSRAREALLRFYDHPESEYSTNRWAFEAWVDRVSDAAIAHITG